MGGEKVLRAAKVAAAAPEDHAAQQALAAAQKELGAGVRRVFEAVWYAHIYTLKCDINMDSARTLRK